MHLFTDKEAYLRDYQADWLPWLGELKAGWTKHDDVDLLPTLQAWWEPLLRDGADAAGGRRHRRACCAPATSRC